MNVQDMKWSDMEAMVTRRLNSLKMCKMGVIASDINKQLSDLGEAPKYTEDEKDQINKKLSSKIRAALTPTLKEVQTIELSNLTGILNRRVKKVIQGAYVHPDSSKWAESRERIMKQKTEREAQLDGDFMDVSDTFKLGIKNIEEFPAEYLKLEQGSW